MCINENKTLFQVVQFHRILREVIMQPDAVLSDKNCPPNASVVRASSPTGSSSSEEENDEVSSDKKVITNPQPDPILSTTNVGAATEQPQNDDTLNSTSDLTEKPIPPDNNNNINNGNNNNEDDNKSSSSEDGNEETNNGNNTSSQEEQQEEKGSNIHSHSNDSNYHVNIPPPPPPLAEPDYTRANKIKFAMLCQKFETLWKKRAARTNRLSKDEKLEFLLPPPLFKYLQGGSPYPLLRLVIPKSDSSRPTTGIKEAGIARAWGGALGLHKESKPYLKLVKFTDPTLAGPKAAGDLSVAIEEVLGERIHKQPSKVTLGEINDLLDELQNIKNMNINKSALARNHAWRNPQDIGDSHKKKKKKGPTKDQMRMQWVEKLIRKKLSPLEHKWIVRIVLQQVEIGLGDSTILKYYSKYALDLWNANNSLKRLCTTLSDPEWLRQRKEAEELEKLNMNEDRRRNHMPRSTAIPALGDVLSPMLAKRTFFREALTDITKRHRQFVKNQSEDAFRIASLALKFPTFICEIKLDGERIVTHMERGIVKMQTRNSNWYSQNYSPVLGPSLRKAINKFDVDVIFDGEVVAWDDGRKETIPFGANRTVASMRRAWCHRQGLIDERDTKLHIDEIDANVVEALPDFVQNKNPFLSNSGEGGNEPGSECWLKYIIFDILYVGGPGASNLVSTSISPNEKAMTGSIINLPAFERKKILYRLIEPQENQVEIVPSLIVRPNGTSCTAAEYFSPACPSSEFGYTFSSLDSIECVLRGDIPNLEEIEKSLRSNRSDTEINQLRAAAVESFYSDIVEDKCMEGLVFKDLASPYVLGDFSREVGYWFKLKADYHESPHHASDIDVIVLGADYATGMSKSGLLNSFLVGCADSENPGKYMTLCKVNGGGASRKELQKLLDRTEYNREAVQEGSFGKWFVENNHGKSLPDFVSGRSFQRVRKADNDGWKFAKDKYPDLWINPVDSVVLTLNAGEITSSDGFSAGVTLRFPRITHVRLGEAAKPPQEVESTEALHELYVNRMNQASEASGISQAGGSSKRKGICESRFFTEEELIQHKKRKPASRGALARKDIDWCMPQVSEKTSAALNGLTFTVLEGTYLLAEDSLDAEEARGQGWYKAAKTVHCREDIMKFVMQHGGKCKLTGTVDTNFVIGGRKDDARVANFHRALNAASKDRSQGGKKSDIPINKIIQLGGVLKWTFVFALVNRWENDQAKSTLEKDAHEEAMRNNGSKHMNPDLIQPGRHDFLVLSDAAEAALTQREDLFGMHVNSISKVDLKRTLHDFSRKMGRQNVAGNETNKFIAGQSSETSADCAKVVKQVPWQFAAMYLLQVDERWVMAGNVQRLWPYRPSASSCKNIQDGAMVIFPCLFRNDMGFTDHKDAEKEICTGSTSTRWRNIEPDLEYSSILAALPLARAMGAQVTPHLHDGVTHVLCDLQNHDHLIWSDDLYPDVFPEKVAHTRLKEMRNVEQSQGKNFKDTMLVTPRWLNSKWPSTL